MAAALLAAGIAVPFLTQSSYFLTIGISAMIFTVFAMSLNIVYGYAGLLSLAQVGFWGVGSYVAALVVTRLDGSIWEGMIAAAVVSAVGGVLIGAAALRLSNHAFVIVSLCFTLLMQMLAQEWIDLTNGPMGIPGLPSPSIGFGETAFAFGTPTRFFYLTLAFAALSLAAIWIVVTSRIGRTFRMIKHDETLARSLGVRVTAWKLVAIALASVFAALSGALYVFYVTIVDPLMDDSVNEAHTDIKLYLAEVNRGEMTADEAQRSIELTDFAINLEHAGDVIAKNLLMLAEERAEKSWRFSDEGWVELTELHERVVENMHLAFNVLVSQDLPSARQLVAEKERMRGLSKLTHQRHLKRLQSGARESIETSGMHIEIARGLKEINSLVVTIAYPILQRSGDLLESRLMKSQA